MTTYLDASVLLRHVLRQEDPLPVEEFRRPVSSVLLRAEVRRSLDRLTVRGVLEPDERLRGAAAAARLLGAVAMLEIDRSLLERAGDPMQFPLGTLDAIHMVSALSWRDREPGPVRLATHDAALAAAARNHGFEVLGA